MESNYFSQRELCDYEKLPIPFCVFAISQDVCGLQAASDGFFRMLGVEREDFSVPCLEFLRKYIHPDDFRQLPFDLDSACLNPEGRYEALYRVRTGENAPFRWISGKGSVVRQTDGSYLLYVFFSDVHDETELHREETADKLRQKVLLSDILSTTQTSIFWKDADRRFLGANKAFLDYYGFSDESEILGKNDEEMGWHTEPEFYKNDEERILQEGISTYRVRGKCIARGKNRDIVASKSPLIVDGKIVGLVGSFDDVTREAEQQTEIHRLNEKLEEQISDRDLLMSISEVCIVKINLEDFTFLEYNDTMYRMIGLTQEEYENRYHHDMKEYFTGEYRKELEDLRQAAKEALAAGQERFALHMCVPSVKGPVWVGGAASFTDYHPETKKPAALYAVYRDITDIIEAQKKQRQAEQKLQAAAELEEQMNRLRRMINDVPSGLGALRIISGTPDETIQLNRYFIRQMDIAIDEIGVVNLGTFLDCLYPGDRERCRRELKEFLQDKTLTSHQYRFRRRDGEYVWISVRGTVVRMSDMIEIAYFVYTNINEMKIAEARLKESQRFYRKVVQAAKLSTWEYDIENHIITMSGDSHTEKTSVILGLPRIIRNVPESIAELVSEEDRPAFLEMYREVEAGRNAFCEAWYKPENGREPRCERITYLVAGHPGEKPVRAIGFSQNITAERKVQERYQRELGYLRQTDENNLLAKGHYNLTRNLVLEYTTKNDDIFKLESGISYDEAFRIFTALPYKKDEQLEIADKLDRKKLIERYQLGQMQTGLIYRRSIEGRLPVWISMNIHTYMMPETGDLECFTYAYDVSGKMETDEIIGLISDEEFDFIGLIYADSDEFEFIKKSPRVTYADTRTRISYSEACNFVCRTYVGEEERGQYEEAVAVDHILSGLHSNGGHHTATYYRTENGRILCKQIDYVWLDKLSHIILVVRSDVTASFERDRKQLARIEAAKLEADRANEAKSAFLSSMSHDLRTPLSGVLGFTELALKENNQDKKQEYLQKIESSGKLLLDLVNDTLELSRIESGKAVLEMEAVMSDELIPAVITSLRPSAELKGVRLFTDFSRVRRAAVWCDRLKVQKIVLNLISNAIKYTPAGGTVSVSLIPSPAEARNCKWSLCVEDNGIGMSEDFMKHMFEPFAQEKRSEAVSVQGTGLGLSIVRHYVDLMGGSIEVNSRLHTGTRWVVSLPVGLAPEGAGDGRTAEKTVFSFSGMRVLLCEDNEMNMEIVSMILKDKGILVEGAENGKIGVQLFSDSPAGYYDAIFMDLRMPVMDGITAVRKIRQLGHPDAAKIPVIAMTADAFEESIREAGEAGMNSYVTKPIEPQKLFTALEKCRTGSASSAEKAILQEAGKESR